MKPSELTLALDNVSLVYNQLNPDALFKERNLKTTAIDKFSVSFEPSKIHGFIGRNGAGKTSLLSVAAGYRKATSGTATINGEPLFENSTYAPHSIFIYQRDFSEEIYTVKKYVKFCGIYRPNFDFEYCYELLEKFGVNKRKRMWGLSKGMASAVSVAIGLASRCPITIFDEAYLGMDAVHRNLFYTQVLAEQERHPRTFIFSTHLISEVEHLFDNVVMIHQGKNLSHNWDPTQQMNLQDLFIELTEPTATGGN